MAEIAFTGFVDDWSKDKAEHPDWGFKASEVHYKKDGDKFVAVARTRRTVKAAFGVEIDLTRFRSGDKVRVVGKEITEVSERDGTKYYNLVVQAQTVELVEGPAQGSDWSATNDALTKLGATPVEDAPF